MESIMAAAQGLIRNGEDIGCMAFANISIIFGFYLAPLIALHIAALFYPLLAQAGQALLHIYFNIGIGIGTGAVIDSQGFLAAFGRENYFAQGHPQIICLWGA